MEFKEFLLEIGVEEIPAGYIFGAMKKIEDFFRSRLKEKKLSFDDIFLYSTPRRFAIKISNLQSFQKDEIIERVGPAKSVSFDENGNLTKAASGFLRGAKATENDIFFKQTPKGEKIAVKLEIKGEKTDAILASVIPELLGKISFPKAMKWSDKKLAFARPIRWLVAIFGDKIVPVEINDIKAGNDSFGNRFQKLSNKVQINKTSDYESSLKKVYVIPNRQERKDLIQTQLKDIFKDSDDELIEDKKLLETVIDLVEYPTAVIAEYEKKYLELPEKVIISTLSEHQKYFAVQDKNGQLVNKFIFISNGNPEFSDLIKAGNEKVIKARLEDAEFYFYEDTKQSLETYIPKLKDVTFQEKLGSLFDKTLRMENITDFLSDQLNLSEALKRKAKRSAHLCKADLVTLMLGEKEFTKLQGYIGMEYADKSGEEPGVPTAIFEHYLPRGQNDRLPNTIAGSLIAIADKMDTVCGIFGVNMIPTGSNDPFALRRAANGIVQIIDKNNFEINLHSLIDQAFSELKNKLEKPDNNKDKVYSFFKQRIKWFLQQKEIDYDVIDSVMHIDFSNIPDLIKRAEVLQKFKQREDFIRLVLGFNRVSNIITEVDEFKEINTTLFQEDTEIKLFEKFLSLKEIINKKLLQKDYDSVLNELVDFSSFIDNFFDDVMVNVEDKNLRNNRYHLLSKIRELFLKVADLAKIVVEGETK